MSNNQKNKTLDYKDVQDILSNNQPIIAITKLVYSFVNHFGNESDKKRFESEDKLYLLILLELFRILGEKLPGDEIESIKLFIEDKETAQADNLEKINYIIYQYDTFLPEIIRNFALNLDSFLKLESKPETYELYYKITSFANEFEKINSKILNKSI